VFLSTRPYFKLQGRLLAAVVSFPLPVYFLILLQQLAIPHSAGVAVATAILLLLFAFLFIAIGFHGLRHRHLFIEVTNLRELLDTRIDPGTSPGSRGFPFGRPRIPLTE
jgi:hypothetical protein